MSLGTRPVGLQPSQSGRASLGTGPVPLLYIAGVGRSGSTLLDRLIGVDERFHSGGEVQGVWELGVLGDRMCSCGARFRACPFWRAISAQHADLLSCTSAETVVSYTDQVLPTSAMWRWATSGLRARAWETRPHRYDQTTLNLYQALQRATGCRAIIDSTKHPVYLYHLARIPGIHVRVVHLIRDPRAVAFSWGKAPFADPDGRTTMSRFGPLEASALWLLWNLLTERVCHDRKLPYLRLKYEALVANPAQSLSRVVAFAQSGDPASGCETAAGVDSMRLKTSHIVSGNPMRFRRDAVHLQEDTAWESQMTKRARRIVSLLTFPLMARYGYL